MNKNSRIYIPGHLGLVGSAILRKLREKGYENFILLDINDLDLVRQDETEKFFLKEKPDYVIDAAAKVGGIVANNTYRAQFIYENLMIQNNIIHASYLSGVKKLLFLGSSCIYPRLAPQPLKEEYLLTGELEPTNEPYAIAKIAGIKMCESYFRQYGCNFISVMPTNLYGPYDNFNLETSHVLPALIRKFHLGKCLAMANWKALRQDLDKRPIENINGQAPESDILAILKKYGIYRKDETTSITLWGSGNPLREFMHVDDMAAACVFIMENFDASRLYQDIGVSYINIGVGEEISIAMIAETVKNAVGYTGTVIWDSSKPDGTPRKLMDVSLLNSLGFKAKIELLKGITEVYMNYTNS
jgi:GDP-L-fucose synthase